MHTVRHKNLCWLRHGNNTTRTAPCVTEASRTDEHNSLKKRHFNFMAHFSHSDRQTAIPAIIVNPQYLTPSNSYSHFRGMAGLAVRLLAKLATECSTMRLQHGKNLGISTIRYQTVTPVEALNTQTGHCVCLFSTLLKKRGRAMRCVADWISHTMNLSCLSKITMLLGLVLLWCPH